MPDSPETLAGLIAPFVGRTGGLLAALHAVQRAHGCLPATTEMAAAQAFNLSRAEVAGVISFYPDFSREPKGIVVRLCAAEACQAVGARTLAAEVDRTLGSSLFPVSATNPTSDSPPPRPRITIEPVYCLGLCACGPAAMVGERLIGRATAASIRVAVERACAQGAR